MLLLCALRDTLGGVLEHLRWPSKAVPALPPQASHLPVELFLEILEHLADDLPDEMTRNALQACSYASTSLRDLALPLLSQTLELDIRSVHCYGRDESCRTNGQLTFGEQSRTYDRLTFSEQSLARLRRLQRQPWLYQQVTAVTLRSQSADEIGVMSSGVWRLWDSFPENWTGEITLSIPCAPLHWFRNPAPIEHVVALAVETLRRPQELIS
ncbi:hypothetical protein JCM10213_008720 [Rhodosporidiobolus nylandii]